MSYFEKFIDAGLINPPNFINKDSIIFEAFVGSVGYGMNTESSDIDIYGIFIPPREIVFPYEYGYIPHRFAQDVPWRCK